MKINLPEVHVPRIVIVGCGFGGLELAKGLADAPVQVVLIDQHNYHTFQPLLYQVSTSGLEADSIAYPIRKIFKGQKNFHFRWGRVERVDAAAKQLYTSLGVCNYDYLVIATGTTTNYFGIEGLAEKSMPMKSVTEALNLRSLILQNFEKALLVTDIREREALMTFVIVGGGPTGVELAGALSELKKHVLPNDYPELDFRNMRIILLESGPVVLQNMSEANRNRALNYLHELGAETWLNTRVIKYDGININTAEGKSLQSANLIWAAGVKGVCLEGIDPKSVISSGRILVDETNAVKGHERIYAIGDVACMVTELTPRGHPQVAPVAIQQGALLARNIMAVLKGQPAKNFIYHDKGSMATIGRNRAVVEIGKLQFGGFMGWAVWMFVHLMSIVGFRNRVVTLINWIWNYLNYDRNIRLIIRPYKMDQN